jgi:pimeloyl-ACP methyl ester carboxylesterase
MLAGYKTIQKHNSMKAKLYLIPGTMCNARLWSELSTCLHHYELVHMAIPSAGNAEQLVEQLASALPARKVALLGFSAGAYLASLLTLHYPEKVEKLMLVSNSPCPLSANELALRQHNLQLINRYGYKGISLKKAEAMIDASLHSPAVVQHLVSIIRQMDTELGEEVLKAQWLGTSERQDLKNELLKTEQPLCFVYSEQDPLINIRWMQDFACHSQAVIHRVAGSGHMLPLEQPQLLSDYIRQWLNIP